MPGTSDRIDPACDMRRHGDAFLRPEQIIRGQRLFTEDIEHGAREMAATQGFEQVFLYELFPAPGIDDIGARSQSRERIAIEDRYRLEVDESLIQLGYYFNPAGRPITGEGRRLTRLLLDLPERPTAIFASGDTLAAGVLQELHQAGLRVPVDISVIGFDDSIADMLTPPLSSIGRPLQQMGIAALDLAIAAIIDSDAERQSIRFETHLVQRNSVT